MTTERAFKYVKIVADEENEKIQYSTVKQCDLLDNEFFFLYVLCPLRRSAIMALKNFRFIVLMYIIVFYRY